MRAVSGLILAALLALVAVAQPTPVFNGTAAWRFALPSPQVVMNPIITDDATPLALVPTNTTLFALQLDSGLVSWAFSVPSGDTGGYVSYSDKMVFLGTQKSVYALSKKDGTVQWSLPLPIPSDGAALGRHARVDYFADSTGNLYITTWNTPLIVVDSLTGILRWSGSSRYIAKEQVHKVGSWVLYLGQKSDGRNDVVIASAADGAACGSCNLLGTEGLFDFEVVQYQNTPVLVTEFTGATEQTLFAFNLTTILTPDELPYASFMWNRSYAGIPQAFDFVYADGLVMVGSCNTTVTYPNYLYATSVADGSIKWTRVFGFDFFLAGSKTLFAFGSPETYLVAYNIETGALRWTYDAIAVNNGAVGGNVVVVGTNAHVVAVKVM